MRKTIDYFDAVSSGDDVELSESVLLDWWNDLLPDETNSQTGRYIFMMAAKQLTAEASSQEALYLKTNGWKVTIKKNLAKNLVTSSLIGGLLYYLGYTQLPGILLPAIVPLLFDVENITLTKKEEQIWLKLPLRPGRRSFKTAAEFYHSLPEPIRLQVNELDFEDFMDKLVLAGFSRVDDKGRYRLLPKGKNVFHLTIE